MPNLAQNQLLTLASLLCLLPPPAALAEDAATGLRVEETCRFVTWC